MTKYLILIISFFLVQNVTAQYEFTINKKINCTPVKNQQRTGTCWSYATASFIESEAIRQGSENIDLSEMYIVRKIYEDKAQNYFLRGGKANFSQGSLSHDLLRAMNSHGLMPNDQYDGKPNGEEAHDHSEMESGLKGYLDGVIRSKRKGNNWKNGVSALLDVYLGSVPREFKVKGKSYTPAKYRESLKLNAEDYVNLSSFSHHPFYEEFILEIPDNYSNGAYHNIKIQELSEVVDYAISKGYSVAWDGDVSEKGFSSKEGIAILPATESEDMFKTPGKEKKVDQNMRQIAFENTATTDDHLMHLVGISFDQKGNKYYIIKNSWGERGPHKGYLHMSAAYFQMKTVAITVHKDALPNKIASKLSK